MDKLIEKTQKKELVYKGHFLEYYKDQVLLPDGRVTSREYLHHPGAIAAVPLLDNGQVLMVKQFRYPTNSILLEIPAGKLETGEEIKECVRRELMEEVGYEPEEIIHLSSVWTTPGFTDEIIHLFLAKGLKPSSNPKDNDEFLEVVAMNKEELLNHIHSGEIIDGKTALALSLMELRKLW